jgi:hypothetical protein
VQKFPWVALEQQAGLVAVEPVGVVLQAHLIFHIPFYALNRNLAFWYFYSY